MRLYLVFPEPCDGLPTTPDPMPLQSIGEHCAQWLQRYEAQGYYSSVDGRVALDEISFRIEPAETEQERAEIPRQPRTCKATV